MDIFGGGAWWHEWQVREAATRMGETWNEPPPADVVAPIGQPWARARGRGLVPKDLCER